MSKLLENVIGLDGVQATYGGGDYRVTVWENVDGGYDFVYTRSNTDIAHQRETIGTAEEAAARMAEFQADAEKWYAVEYDA